MTLSLGALGLFAITFVAAWKTIATLVSMAAVVVAVYSYLRLTEIMKAETKKIGHMPDWSSAKQMKNERWERVEGFMRSGNQSDWKVAIMEADNILDDIVEKMGYPGETLGERMKEIEASDFPYLDDAWEAHKVRNNIAHKGTDFVLSKATADDVVSKYYRIFKALGYL